MLQEPSSSCPNCGQPLGESAPMGLCPACLFQAGLGTATDTGPDKGGAGAFVPPAPEELRARFPQLEILQLVGRGGMGAVYKARQKALDRWVALKILPPGLGDAPAFAARFAQEAKALAQLHHPHIVTLYEFGEADGLFYFLMEFVDGVNLRQLLNAGRLSPGEALAIVPQICEALQFAHDRGIVHRDIKPENILLNKDGQVKIADFGVARIVAGGLAEATDGDAAGSAPAQTEAGKIIGTPQYMAPEQVTAPLEVDHRADIYALGVVFYQMLTGELPAARLEPPSRKVVLDVRLDEVVLRALEQEPARRYQQARVLGTRVETIAGTPLESRAVTTANAPGPAQLSRAAIAGICWIPFFLAAAAFLAFEPQRVRFPYEYKFPAAMGIILSLSGCFGTTVLGWVAVAQIRRSAGRLYGLGLAVFDGLFFPLLALDYAVTGLLFSYGLGFLGWSQNYDPVHNAQLIVVSGLVWVVMDVLIIRAVWRAVKPQADEKPSAAWKWALGVAGVCGVLVCLLVALFTVRVVSPVSRPADAANLHYQVFEADAAAVDEVVPLGARQLGVMPGIKPFANNATVSLGDPRMPPDTVFSDAQCAEVSAAAVASLSAPSRPPLVEHSRLIYNWPATADTWSYSKADGTMLGGGVGSGFVGVQRVQGVLRLRLEYRLTHSINALSERPGKQWISQILYEGQAARPGHALLFLVPFSRPPGPAKYLVIAFDTERPPPVEQPSMPGVGGSHVMIDKKADVLRNETGASPASPDAFPANPSPSNA